MKRTWSIYLTAVATVLIWSHAPVTIKYCLRTVGPWDLVILRHVPAALVFGLYWAFSRQRRYLWDMARAHFWRLLLLGVAAVSGYHLALNFGSTRISAGTASLIIGMAPAFTFFVAAALLGERSTRRAAAGIVLAFAGLYLCVRYGGGRRVEVTYMLAALVTLLAPFFSSLHTTLSRPLARQHGALNLTALTIIFGTAPLLVTIRPSLISRLPTLSASFWAADLFLGLACTAFAYALWAHALRHLEATRVAVFLYLLPLLGLVWGSLYLAERVTGWLVLGGLMIVAGVVLTNRAPSPK